MNGRLLLTAILVASPVFTLDRRADAAPAMCLGQMATIVGTPGNDTIHGTPGDDVIAGLGGDDTIYGEGGNDIICGDDGNDVLFGGPGDDVLLGGGRGRRPPRRPRP